MRISTVIPMYNAEKYIEKTLESLLKQSNSKNIEIIIVDDGSSDRSATICDKVKEKHSNMKVYHIENHGVSYARNYGLMRATGDYVHFLDADDVIDNQMYEKFLNIAIKYNPDIIVSGCKIQNIYNKNDFKIKHIKESKFLSTKKECTDMIQNIDFKEDTWMFDYIWNKWYKIEKLRKFKITFNEQLNISEDFAFNCDFFCNIENVYLMKDILYTYKWHGEGLVMNFHDEPWKMRKIVYIKEKNMGNVLKIPGFKTKIDDFEGFNAFGTLKSINNPKCYYNKKQRKKFICEYIKSWQYEKLLKYLKRKNSIGKFLCVAIKIKPKISLCFLVQLDKLQRKFKN